MTDSNRTFFVAHLAKLRSSLDEINLELAANVIDSYGYVLTHFGSHMDIKVRGTVATANHAPLLRCTRYTKRDAEKIANAFGKGWSAEHWRVTAERYTQFLQDTIAQIEAVLS